MEGRVVVQAQVVAEPDQGGLFGGGHGTTLHTLDVVVAGTIVPATATSCLVRCYPPLELVEVGFFNG
ncbi:hypothetical protein GCM10007170_29080 [Arthrobacter liuii]|uniref:Uncharacterized protein n=1 Tax=Arthrobacter liuii TaxID=1476996 RepID=A0ABQ2AU84_9MICC|nr:hypothetical protein GCM10007170_29080 [Arthrobacter liuii]